LNIRKNQRIRDEILLNLNCTKRDLACECLGELFCTQNDSLIEINNFFQKKFPNGLEGVHVDIIKANIGLLIKSKTNQHLSEIREDLGDPYFKIRKAVSTEIARKNGTYKKIIFNGKKYVAANHNFECNFNLPQIDKDTFLTMFFDIKLKKYDVAKVLREAFILLNSQNEYAKAVEEKLLLDTMKDFYIAKMNDFIFENVEYNNIEEEIDERVINHITDYERNI
jgi:hypothetical protein